MDGKIEDVGWHYEHTYILDVRDDKFKAEIISLSCISSFGSTVGNAYEPAAIYSFYAKKNMSAIPGMWKYYNTKCYFDITSNNSIINMLNIMKGDKNLLTEFPLIDVNKYYPCLIRYFNRRLFSSNISVSP